jgi:carbonic anhydrase/acetyltransferase-like protein (isoleucine patch superfamily)
VPIVSYKDKSPRFGESVFVDPTAVIIGDVELLDHVNVWPGAVLRGDTERITLGRDTCFQDNSVAHSDPGFPISVGDRCVVGHGVVVHGAIVGADCLIGMGSTLLNGSVIGDHSIVGANSLVTQGKAFPPRSLIVGSPAARVRELTDADLEKLTEELQLYKQRSLEYIELGLGTKLPPASPGAAGHSR